MSSKEVILSSARQFLNYVNKSPSPYHAVDEVKKRLVAAGFNELKEADHWQVQPKHKVPYGEDDQFSLGTHLRLCKTELGVDNKIEHRLVHVERPILRIPHIAIHLQRDHNEKFSPNKETNVCPVLATEVQSKLCNNGPNSPDSEGTENAQQSQKDKHHSLLVQLLCEELKVEADQLMDFDLHLADTQPAVIGGVLEEFIFSPRLDNLLNAYTAMVGLISSCSTSSLDNDTNIRMISLFDNEEVGSSSAQGAGSSFQEYVLRRLSSGGNQTAFEEAIPKSYMISADQAHAIHPNYSDKHESNHQPGFHKGIVVKINGNQRYASTGITNTILREVGRMADIPLQDFVVRNDSPCGSTIGPIMSAKLGMATVDIGAPQLSMHSIREMCCTSSVWQAQTLYQTFFERYPEVYNSLNF
ncbi:aspartyl aminopeptidase-like [Ruditapes philippinarum]|uniref:aspartyl aminopeptidase-like n=1 Tax=Ruditapes philippinarum TaxID=129788 RepID=UPI00295B5B20|nr:aspartyl aminopeptidase-like [Ruditapes philippinarum]